MNKPSYKRSSTPPQDKDARLGRTPIELRSQSLFAIAMGSDFKNLHPALQTFHSAQGEHFFEGIVLTHETTGFVARAMAWVLGTPSERKEGPLQFKLIADGPRETWTRFFPGKTMSSVMRLVDGRVVERLGPAEVTFSLRAANTSLAMELVALHFFGIRCPRWLMPTIEATEFGKNESLHFSVRATLPFIGTVARYVGHLRVFPVEKTVLTSLKDSPMEGSK